MCSCTQPIKLMYTTIYSRFTNVPNSQNTNAYLVQKQHDDVQTMEHDRVNSKSLFNKTWLFHSIRLKKIATRKTVQSDAQLNVNCVFKTYNSNCKSLNKALYGPSTPIESRVCWQEKF